MIASYSWADLGFCKVGPRNTRDLKETASARMIAALFKERARFETRDDATGVWIRDPGKVKAQKVSDAVRMAISIDAAQSTLPASYDAADAVAASEFGQFQPSPTLPLSKLRSSYESFESTPRSAKGIYDLVYAVSTCRNEELSAFLRKDVSAAFFRSFPKGRIVLLTTSYEYERRQGAVRGAYTLSQYSISDVQQLDGLKTRLIPLSQVALDVVCGLC